MAQTKIILSSTGQEFNVPGLRTVAQVVADFSESVAGIGALDYNLVDGADGNRTITFSLRTGTKGAETRIVVTSTGQTFNVPGTRTAAQVVADFSDSIAGISAMAVTTAEVDGVTVHTFSLRTGTKGAASTKIVITGTGQEFNVPGTRTAAQVVADFSDSIAGLSAMASEVSVAGEVTTITFSPRTGTKGDC